jgi:hypothetical protein
MSFFDGTTLLGRVPLAANNFASIGLGHPTPGTHVYSAVYSGSATTAVSVSTILWNPTPVAPPRVLEVLRYGFHWTPTTLVVQFSAPLDQASATNTGNYWIIGPAGQKIPVSWVSYDASSNSVTLHPQSNLDLHKAYYLTVIGVAPTGVRGSSGELLDGAGTGQPGTNYVTVLTAANLVVTNAFAPGAAAALRLKQQALGGLV